MFSSCLSHMFLLKKHTQKAVPFFLNLISKSFKDDRGRPSNSKECRFRENLSKDLPILNDFPLSRIWELILVSW